MAVVTNGAEIRTSWPAGAGLTEKAFYLVKLSAGTVVLCAAATDIPIGVLQEGVAEGLQAEIVALGASKIVADGVVAAGAQIGTSADGQADAKVAGSDTTNYVCGVAVEAAAAAGDVIQAFINCVSPHRAA